MKKLLIGAAALGLAMPGTAQVAAPAPAQKAERPAAAKAHSRAAVEAHVARMFARLDSDRDGFLTKAEAEAGRGEIRTKIVERVKQRAGAGGGDVFARLDANNDGAITRAEWDAGREQRKEQRAQDGSREQRKERVTERATRAGGAHRMAMIGGRMFETADSNRDGRVSLDEARAGALRHFDQLDANRDGQISGDERIQIRKRIRTEPSAG